MSPREETLKEIKTNKEEEIEVTPKIQQMEWAHFRYSGLVLWEWPSEDGVGWRAWISLYWGRASSNFLYNSGSTNPASLVFLLISFSFSMLTLLEAPAPWGLTFWHLSIVCACQLLLVVTDSFAALWTVATRLPRPVELSRQWGDPWNGWASPPFRGSFLPKVWIGAPVLVVRFLPLAPPGKPHHLH